MPGMGAQALNQTVCSRVYWKGSAYLVCSPALESCLNLIIAACTLVIEHTVGRKQQYRTPSLKVWDPCPPYQRKGDFQKEARSLPGVQPGTAEAAFMVLRAFSAEGWMMLVKMASEGVTWMAKQ